MFEVDDRLNNQWPTVVSSNWTLVVYATVLARSFDITAREMLRCMIVLVCHEILRARHQVRSFSAPHLVRTYRLISYKFAHPHSTCRLGHLVFSHIHPSRFLQPR